MRAIKSKETGPELSLRRALWAAGLRGYRKNVQRLPGRPDIVFGRARVVVFVHGCYWHSCPKCVGARRPSVNQAYWLPKLKRTQERDELNSRALQTIGYRVLVVWECDLRDLDAQVERVRQALTGS